MKVLAGDEAFYFKHNGDSLEGMILTQVDDFFLAGKSDFIEAMTKKIQENLTISKIEKDKFRFNGIDFLKTDKGIEISMKDYAESIEEIKDIRKAKKEEPLTKIEMKLYRKMTGKINWLADNTRPDLAICALSMSRRNSKATIGDLKMVNHVVKRIKNKENKVVFTKVGKKEDFIIHGLGDASYKCDEKSIGGNLVLLGNMNNNDAVPLLWKTKTITQVCHSAKDAETRNVTKLVDDMIYLNAAIGATFVWQSNEQNSS